MADQKISQLTGGGAAQATDEYVVARAGGNNKITGANVAAAATSVGTLTSLTVSGNLTVDTNTLFVDATNNDVGIGTTDPATWIDGTIGLSIYQGTTGRAVLSLAGTNTSANETLGRILFTNSATTNAAKRLVMIDGVRGADANSGYLTFSTANSGAPAERMRLDASGEVLVGTSTSVNAAQGCLTVGRANDAALLSLFRNDTTVTGNDLGVIEFSGNDTTGNIPKVHAAIYGTAEGSHSAGSNPTQLRFWTTPAGSETIVQRMTLDASGNLGVGTTSPGNILELKAATPIAIFNQTTTNSNQGIQFQANGSTYGRILNNNATGVLDIRNGLNSGDGYLITFSTDGTERARITSAGFFKASDAGTYDNATGLYHETRSSSDNAQAMQISHTGSSPYGLSMKFSAASPDNNTNYFQYLEDSTALRCVIYSDGDILNHDGTYGTLPSERRFKQDITDASTQWDDIKNIRLRRYRMISDVETKGEEAPYHLGVIIDELEQVSPGLVVESPVFEQREVTDEDGNVTIEQVQVDTVKGWKTSIVHLKALKALQEAMARIEALEARLEALEA